MFWDFELMNSCTSFKIPFVKPIVAVVNSSFFEIYKVGHVGNKIEIIVSNTNFYLLYSAQIKKLH